MGWGRCAACWHGGCIRGRRMLMRWSYWALVVLVGCGATRHAATDEEGGNAGSAAGGADAGPANASGAPASGALGGEGGSALGGEGGSAPGAGAGGGAGGEARFPLLRGDADCPSGAPTSGQCSGTSTCVYAGIAVGLSGTLEPVSCACVESQWSCVSSDEEGQSLCPPSFPDMESDVECPPQAAQPCLYPRFNQQALAVCSCSGSGEGGAPHSNWLCGV